MKLKFVAVVALFIVPAFSASAISASYHKQLERSGCTQQTDGNGCDIHKTKAQNRAAEARLQKNHGQSLDQISSEVDSIVGMDSYEFDDYLYRHGWSHSAFGEYTKGNWKLHFKVEGGKVVKSELAK